MRKLLNTLYITSEDAYLSLDGETVICRTGEDEKFRIPFDNVESIVAFNYVGCSPALMGKCVEKGVSISFISPQGKFLANISGSTRGNVVLRVKQIDVFRENGVKLTQNTVAAKLGNTISLLKHSIHDNEELRTAPELLNVIDQLTNGINAVYSTQNIDEIRGIEGNCAKCYFSVFQKLMSHDSPFIFENRSQRPPLDPVNTMLSFVYTIYTNEFASALETVGLDSYIGYYHTLRSGRASLACDMIEEARCIVERFVLTMLNLRIVNDDDFTMQVSGAVLLNSDGRKKLLTKWQEKKRTEYLHPYLKEKILFGLIPYAQSCLLAKYIRGDIDEYPSLIIK